jgi:hypothetical protein
MPSNLPFDLRLIQSRIDSVQYSTYCMHICSPSHSTYKCKGRSTGRLVARPIAAAGFAKHEAAMKVPAQVWTDEIPATGATYVATEAATAELTTAKPAHVAAEAATQISATAEAVSAMPPKRQGVGRNGGDSESDACAEGDGQPPQP